MGIVNRVRQGISGFVEGWRRGGMSTVAELSSASPAVSDKHIQNLELAQKIYSGNPPWLNDTTPPMKCAGYGMVSAQEIAQLVMTRSEIKIGDMVINDIIKSRVMPKLQQNIERGWALGGLIFKPYYSSAIIEFANGENGEATDRVIGISGKIKIIHLTPTSYLVDIFDDAGDIQQIRFFTVTKYQDKYYTKVELQRYDETTRTLTINNTIFNTGSISPSRFRWDNLGTETVPITSIPRWATIPAVMTFSDVDGCLIGVYSPPVANNDEEDSGYALSPLVRAQPALRFLDKIQFLIDWEIDATRARMLLDEMALDGVVGENKVIAEELKGIIIKLHGRGENNIYEVFSPAIRHEAFIRLNEAGKRWLEDLIGFTHSQLSEATGRGSRTATEILQNQGKTISTKKNNQDNLGIAIEQLSYAIQVLLYPTRPKEDILFEFVWGSPAVVSNQDRIPQLQNMRRDGAIAKWRMNMMVEEVSEDVGKEMTYEALEEEIVLEKKKLELLKKHGMKESDVPQLSRFNGGYDYRLEASPTDADGNNDGG